MYPDCLRRSLLPLVLVAHLLGGGAGAAPLPGGQDRAFRTAQGHTPAACRRNAREREEAGDLPGAARWTRLAVFLDPADRESRARLAAWKAPLHGPPSELLRRIGPLDVDARRALSLGWLGEPREATRILADREDPVAEAIRVQLLADVGEFDVARNRLDELVKRAPAARALALYLRSTMAQWDGDSEAEGRFLDGALRLAPSDPELLGARASREVAAGNSLEGERWLRFEASLPKVSDPVRLATRATLLAFMGRTDAADRDLARLVEEHVLSPQAAIVEASLRLRQGRHREAARSLEDMIALTRGSMVLIPAANLLASIGRQDLARKAVHKLEPRIARSPKVVQLLEMLSSLPADGRTKEGRSGSFVWLADADLPMSAIDGAILVFEDARVYVDRRLGRKGPEPVHLTIVFTPGEAPWGYYDAVRRRIVCRGDYRGVAREKRWSPLIEHVARHEYGHLAFDALLRREGEGIVPYPRWLMEGIADQLAGGIEYLEQFGYDLDKLDPAPMSGDALARVLAAPVLGLGRIKQGEQAQAYAQSHAMVGELLEKIGAEKNWLRLAAFIRRLGEGRDLAKELERQFGSSVQDLSAAYTRDQVQRVRGR